MPTSAPTGGSLTDNKTMKASPATHPARGGTVNTAGSTLTNLNIAQSAQNVNTQYQKTESRPLNEQHDPHVETSVKPKEPNNIEPAGSFTPPIAELPATVTDSKISIEHLLQYVNSLFR